MKRPMYRMLPLLLWMPLLGADEVRIVKVDVECRAACTFHVTLAHGDEGWNHYADRWDVLTPSGELLKSRVLYHPHVNEQPFTRSLSGVKLPDGINQVTIRARDSKHGYSDREVVVELPAR